MYVKSENAIKNRTNLVKHDFWDSGDSGTVCFLWILQSFAKYLRIAASVFRPDKAEDSSLHTYHFTMRDCTTTAQRLNNNFCGFNKGTS